MYYGQVFADVVGAVFERTDTEYPFSCSDHHSLVFHRAGVAGTCGVDGDGIAAYFRECVVVDVQRLVVCHGAEQGHLFGGIAAVGFGGGFQ